LRFSLSILLSNVAFKYSNILSPVSDNAKNKELISLTHHERILLVTDKEDAETLSQSNDLTIKTLEEYPQPRERNFLVLLIDNNHASTNKIGAVVDKLQIAPLF